MQLPPETSGPPKPRPESAVRDHLANERTLLAWVRTALTIVGLGFLISRLLVTDEGNPEPVAEVIGVALIMLGAGASVLSAVRFLRIQREIDEASFHPTSRLDLALAGGVAIAAVVLAAYLLVVA
jgi:putative membrane protein